jgi:hypothetical protein
MPMTTDPLADSIPPMVIRIARLQMGGAGDQQIADVIGIHVYSVRNLKQRGAVRAGTTWRLLYAKLVQCGLQPEPIK